jgi:biopolymer transport protein ExbD
MRRFSDRHTLTTLSELNVTPLLDLAFVLLIIFMITTPLMENKVDLILPSSQEAEGAVNPAAVRVVSVNRDQVMKFEGKEVSPAQLEVELTESKAAQPDLAIVVQTHRDLPVQALIDVMDVLQRAQITKIGIVTNPEP